MQAWKLALYNHGMAQYGLFVLKVPLNPNRPTDRPTNQPRYYHCNSQPFLQYYCNIHPHCSNTTATFGSILQEIRGYCSIVVTTLLCSSLNLFLTSMLNQVFTKLLIYEMQNSIH